MQRAASPSRGLSIPTSTWTRASSSDALERAGLFDPCEEDCDDEGVKGVFYRGGREARMIPAARMAASAGPYHPDPRGGRPYCRFKCVEGALAAREACREIIDLQTIAFPQEGG